MLSFELLQYGTAFLFALAILIFFTKNDEFLILIVLFFYSTGIERYNLIITGREKWAVVAYSLNIFKQTNELGLAALNFYFLGIMVMCLSYAFFQSRPDSKQKKDDPIILKNYLEKHKTTIIVGFAFVSIISFYSRLALIAAYHGGGVNIAMGVSYSLLIGFAFGGFIILTYLVYKNIDFKRGFIVKAAFGAIIVYAGLSTFSSSGRFQFLSWSIAIGLMYVKDMGPIKKLRIYLVGGFIITTAFGFAGVSRSSASYQMSFSEKVAAAWQRNSSREDQNMLDGFMMVLQVYPRHLNYHYGTEHLEILARPIPRSWWPNKPKGGYANKLGLNDNMGGGSVGISQSLIGSFYGEGGWVGIVVFSILYAYFFNYFFKTSKKFDSDLKYVIKGAVFSSCLPLLRGGDIPGIYAFIGMTFWPVFIFIFYYNKYAKNEIKLKFAKLLSKNGQTKTPELAENIR